MQHISIFNAHNGTLQIMWELSSTEDSTCGTWTESCIQTHNL